VKPSEILERAAVVLMERGHYKGNYEAPGGGPVCLHGAVNCVLTGDASEVPYGPVASTVVAALTFTAGRPDLATWNDDPATSAEDVILLCKKTAVQLAEGGR
jgi:hypothetical protein